MTRIHDLLVREGFDGSYDAVRRYAARWRAARRKDAGEGAPAFIPMTFQPGEAYQFDWSHEDVEIAGKPMRVKVAHMRLCDSRAPYVRAYPREGQEMLFDAHARAFAFFGGVPRRGIYDNMKTAVTAVFTGKERVFNRRFLIMTDHYMVEPTACSPAAGWEKGQVEQQVQTIRGRFFQPRLRFASLAELNGWLEAECRRWAEHHAHPERGDITVAEALDMERPALQPILAPFDGFHESEHAVTGTCLISFDRNRYSVMSTAARRTVQVRSYADRIVIRCGDAMSGSMSATSVGTARYTIPGIICRSSRTSPARCVTAHRSRTGICRPPCTDYGEGSAPGTRPIAGSCGSSRRCSPMAWSR